MLVKGSPGWLVNPLICIPVHAYLLIPHEICCHASRLQSHKDRPTTPNPLCQWGKVPCYWTQNRPYFLTHWGRMTHICVGKPNIIGSDNGLLPDRHQAIIWTNAGILLIGPLGTNFSEISIRIKTFSFKKMHLKMASAKWRPFCLGLNLLTHWGQNKMATIVQMLFPLHFLEWKEL